MRWEGGNERREETNGKSWKEDGNRNGRSHDAVTVKDIASESITFDFLVAEEYLLMNE